MARTEITQQIIEAGAVAVIRMKETDRLLHVAEALLAGGWVFTITYLSFLVFVVWRVIVSSSTPSK